MKEWLTGLNTNVRHVHNKFMIVDPLSYDPIVVAGSANFRDASTRQNDENMIVVRGNKRVADIYLGEFMRLYSHHAFRESLGCTRSQSRFEQMRGGESISEARNGPRGGNFREKQRLEAGACEGRHPHIRSQGKVR